jgi:hypothetical protein
MKIDCFISMSCSSGNDLKKNIAEALKLESIDADVNLHRIDDTEAERLKLMGSPSILINGEDILPDETPGFS